MIADPTARIAALTVAFAATLSFTAPFWTIPPTFLSGAAAAGGYGTISSLGVIGGFFAPTIIGYFSGITGDFRGGLGAIAVLAMGMSAIFFFTGRRLSAAAVTEKSLA
jgi:ACS family phthalate transporter-like MFS transporter